MVERVAKAIGDAADQFSFPREVLKAAGGEPERYIRDKLARAAIEAMRKPPEAICERLKSHFHDPDFDGDAEQVTALVNDFIDEALKDG